MPKLDHDPYLVRSVVHASQILATFQSPLEVLRLRDVVQRSGFGKGMCFRLLHTLHHCGFLEKVDAARYRLVSEPRRRKRFRIGYAAQGQASSFAREVQAGLRSAAEPEDVELIVVDNRYQPKVALRNAQYLIRHKVDLAIEFQTDDAIAPAIAATYLEANVPFIAIDIPHPGATYFGANNYQAGVMAGRHLGHWARARWGGAVDEILLVELARAGSLVRARMSGVMAGLRETLQGVDDGIAVTLDGDGQFEIALEKVRRHLRRSRASRVLVGAANDSSALGATRAFQEAGRTAAVVGQNAEPDARAELREPRTPLVGSVGYFPERYGTGIVKLALDILGRRRTPPAVFIRHQLITRENVDEVYANDLVTGHARGLGA